MELAWFVGVDWGSQTHQACVIDVAGKLLGERAFEHGGQGLSEMADWVVSFAAGAADQVGVAIETPRGPVVERPDGTGLRGPRDQSEAARPLPRPPLAGGGEGRPTGCAGAGLGAAHRPALSAAAGADRPSDRRVAGVVAHQRRADAGTHAPGQSDARAALALLPAAARRDQRRGRSALGARPVAAPADAGRGAARSRGDARQTVATAPHPPGRCRDAAGAAAGAGHPGRARCRRGRRRACAARRRNASC